MEEKILSDIIRFISKIKKDLDKNLITPEAGIVEDLGMDSLDVVELVIELEDEYNFEFEEKNAKDVVTIQDLVNKIKKIVDKSKSVA